MNLKRLVTPDFPLAPWELMPDSPEPLVAPATCLFHVSGKPYLARVASTSKTEAEVFVRSAFDRRVGNWHFGTFGYSSLERDLTQSQKADYLRPRLEKIFKPKARLIFQDMGADFGMCRVVLDCFHPFLNSPQHGNPISFKLRSFSNGNAEKLSATQMRDAFLQEWRYPNSALNFSLNWTLLSDEEKEVRSVVWKNGNRAACQALIDKILVATSPSWSGSEHFYWSLNIPKKTFTSGVPWYDDSGFVPPPTPAAVAVWETTVTQFFAPSLTAIHKETWISKVHFKHLITAQFSDPTNHERLEAVLQLRDWVNQQRAVGEILPSNAEELLATLR